MDALSQLLLTLRVRRAVFSLSSPLQVPVPAPQEKGSLPISVFCALTGGCTLTLEGSPPQRLAAGEVALVSRGTVRSLVPLPADADSGPPEVLCASLAVDAALSRQLLTLLPPVVCVPLQASVLPSWLQACIWLAGPEDDALRPGSDVVAAKAAELLLAETVRAYLSRERYLSHPYAVGLRDRIVGACLADMHGQPAEPWTLERLARRANTSRSVLAERFKQLVGEPPMSYLTQWRMALAANLLRDTSMCLIHIAAEVGYETDTAFSRAFRREFGLPPAAWRRAHAVRDNGAAPASPEPVEA